MEPVIKGRERRRGGQGEGGEGKGREKKEGEMGEERRGGVK